MPEKKNRIRELKTSRIKPSKYLENFFFSFFRATRLMHECIKSMSSNQNLVEEAKRNYIISLVSCLETFYRDLLIHILDKDKVKLENVMLKIKEKKTLLDIYKMLQEEIGFHEYVASHFKFQSIEEIEDVFSALFLPGGYLKAIGDHQHHCYILSKSPYPVVLTLSKEWRKNFAFLFEVRHRLVHDANSPCNIPPSKMAELETLTLMICQFTSFFIDQQYGKTMALEKDGKPAFFITDDFLADDWEIGYGGNGYRVISKP